MDIGELILVAGALLTAFGMGIWLGFAKGFRFTMSLAAPILDMAKQTKGLLSSGPKTGMWDIVGMLVKSGGLKGMLGGKP